MKKALVLIDVQNDFVPGGNLAVPEGDQVVPVANALQKKFNLVVATQDWHPPTHGSFAANHDGRQPGELIELNGLQQVLWPVHCVENTEGAEFHPKLDRTFTKVFQKGTDVGTDSYSGFFDNGHRRTTGMGDWMKEQGITDLVMLGLATDYCVKFSVLDALKLGFKVTVVQDGCRGVNLQAGDDRKAFEEMAAAGAVLTTSDKL